MSLLQSGGYLCFKKKQDTVFLFLDFSPTYLSILYHGDEGSVIDLYNPSLSQPGHGQQVEQHQHKNYNAVVVDQRLFWRFDFVHLKSPFVFD